MKFTKNNILGEQLLPIVFGGVFAIIYKIIAITQGISLQDNTFNTVVLFFFYSLFIYLLNYKNILQAIIINLTISVITYISAKLSLNTLLFFLPIINYFALLGFIVHNQNFKFDYTTLFYNFWRLFIILITGGFFLIVMVLLLFLTNEYFNYLAANKLKAFVNNSFLHTVLYSCTFFYGVYFAVKNSDITNHAVNFTVMLQQKFSYVFFVIFIAVAVPFSFGLSQNLTDDFYEKFLLLILGVLYIILFNSVYYKNHKEYKNINYFLKLLLALSLPLLLAMMLILTDMLIALSLHSGVFLGPQLVISMIIIMLALYYIILFMRNNLKNHYKTIFIITCLAIIIFTISPLFKYFY